MALRPFAPPTTIDPYPTHKRLLRRSSPYHEPDLGAWMVTRQSDITAILRNPRVFSSAGRSAVDDPARMIVLVNEDPPRHTQLRALVQRPLARRLDDTLGGWIATLVDDLLDAIDPDDTEIMKEIGGPLPVSVISHLLGIPAEDRDIFMRMRSPQPGQSQEERVAEFTAIVNYLRRLVAARQQVPQDDLISELFAVEIDGPDLEEWEVIGLCITLLVAGNETTSNLIANLLNVLAERPALWQRLREEPALIPTTIEEVIRWQSPTQTIFRTTTEITEIGGTRVPSGSVVGLAIGAANRDPRVFATPDTLDPDRDLSAHLGFGSGAHYCIGAPFARLEVETLLRALMKRFATIELGATAAERQTESPFVLGFRRLPLRFTR